ncbi:hypothetical protein [Methyloradius palustris]|uniref:Uncharacterized protein n=1 Tax=Methyloradius palustris TaxID=2778876 RepID=A0A8D5G915_9PROT|nr:hypothetical protein [Methyloradius palustris]BCM25372.1 hypothetical protein ZMTM_16310 [Methyloradius palustris]
MLRLFILVVPLLCVFGISSAETPLPTDVSSFLELRESCDHWRGEYGYDKDRQSDIDWSICQSCPGTDAKLAKLKRKYKNQESVMIKLNDLESKIESKDKAATLKFCKTTRKPEWYEK